MQTKMPMPLRKPHQPPIQSTNKILNSTLALLKNRRPLLQELIIAQIHQWHACFYHDRKLATNAPSYNPKSTIADEIAILSQKRDHPTDMKRGSSFLHHCQDSSRLLTCPS